MTPARLPHRAALAAALALTVAACGSGSGTKSPPGGPPPLNPSDPADVLYAQGLVAYNAGARAVADARVLDPGLASTAARSLVATGEASYVAAMGFFDMLTSTYPTSVRVEYAGYYAGRSAYEIGTADPATVPTTYLDARSRLEALAAQRPSSPIGDKIAYFEGRARFHLAGLRPPLAPLDTWAAARSALSRSLALGPAGTFADNAQYYLGRTWFEEAFPIATDPANAVTAQTRFQTAERELARVWTSFPASTYVDNARYYWGISKIMEPEPVVSTRVANLQDAVTDLGLVIATAGTAAPSPFVAGAHYWRGNAHYDLAFRLASGAVKDRGQVLAAVDDFHAVPPPDSHAARALYHLAKSYVWLDPDGAGTLTATCTGGTGPAPSNAHDACLACADLVNAPGSLYAGSTSPASCAAYITSHGCTYP